MFMNPTNPNSELLAKLDDITAALESIASELSLISEAIGPINGQSVASIVDQLQILNQSNS